MDNSDTNDFLNSMKDLSKQELQAIVDQPEDCPEEKVTAAVKLLNMRSSSLDFARMQIENEVAIDEIVAQLKNDGVSEIEAAKIIQDASMSADLDRKENEAIAEAAANEEGSIWSWVSGIITIIVIVRLIMRFVG